MGTLEHGPDPIAEPENSFLARAPAVLALEAAVVPIKYNFEHTFNRPVFTAKARVPVLSKRGFLQLNYLQKITYKNEVRLQGCPNPDFIKANKLSTSSHPIEWFEALYPNVGAWTTNTNFKATILENAVQPGQKYADFKPFTIAEIKQHLALYIFNGLSCSVQMQSVDTAISSHSSPLWRQQLNHHEFEVSSQISRLIPC